MNPIIRAVIRKEFREYRRNRLILFTAVLLPLIFLAIPLLTLAFLPSDAPEDAIAAVIGQAMLFFFIVPVMIPTTIAAYAVIGEREQSTLEPVLTTPATDRQLLLGKAVAAVVPSVLLGWLLFTVFVLVVIVLGPEAARDEILRLEWVLAQVLLAPLLAMLSIEVGLAISARSSDIRVAQQLGGLAMLPIIFGIMGIAFGIITLEPRTILIGAVIGVVVVRYTWRLVEGMFDRERVITKYG